MIAVLEGTIWEKSPNEIVINVGGVGYQVTVPITTFSVLPDRYGSVTLRIHTHVREDALVLFGFATSEEKLLFEKLIAVSGIGPKLAIAVLSGLPAGDLVAAIRQSDVGRLVRIPGVGKKTAERIVLELKDKLAGIVEAALPAGAAPPAGTTHLNPMERDILSALQNLGCARPAAEEAIKKVNERGAPVEFEAFFRAALALIR